MAESPNKYCFNCMAEKDSYDAPCPNCGSVNSDNSEFPFALKAGSSLNGKYIVGNVKSVDGEGVKYIARDTQSNQTVYIKEYFPSEFAQRSEGCGVTVNPEHQAQYKALMYEFVDLGKAIKSLSDMHGIVHVKDVFTENNTAYTVSEYKDAITYGEFLEKCGGSLDWDQAKTLFMPLFGTLTNVHKHGILHCGISPETVLVQQDGTMLLSDFEIPSARTAKSELKAKLYSGFSAPEQYSPSDWQGTWTDVYAMGAMLYNTLSGITLPDAAVRKYEDNVMHLSKCCDSVPENVVNTIMHAIEVPVQNRLQIVDEFSCRLIDSGNNTAVYKAEKGDMNMDDIQDSSTIMFSKQSAQTPEETKTAPKNDSDIKVSDDPKEDKKRNRNYIILAAALSGVLLLLIVIIMLVSFSGSKENESSSSQSSSISSSAIETDNKMPSFVGRYVDDVKDNAAYKNKFEFSIKSEYNDEYAEGVIFKQTPKEGKEITGEKTAVTLYVSKGKEESSSSEESSSEEEKITIPNFIGRDINDVENNQSYSQYFIFSVKYENKEDIAPGQIYDQSPQEGEEVTGKTTVTLYVSKGPRMEIMPDVANTQLSYAEKTLNDLGIKYEIEYVEDSTVVEGNVVRASKLYGETIYLDRDTVILYVNKGSSSGTSTEGA